jgi:hypothetical protein
MSERLTPTRTNSTKPDSFRRESFEPENERPLLRTQTFLIELKTTISLLCSVLLEFKDLLLIVASIVFFILGILKVLGY